MEEIRKDIKEMRESQIRMESDLKYHIKRTDLLEEKVDEIERDIQPMPLKDKLQIGAFIAAMITAFTAVIKHLGLN